MPTSCEENEMIKFYNYKIDNNIFVTLFKTVNSVVGAPPELLKALSGKDIDHVREWVDQCG